MKIGQTAAAPRGGLHSASHRRRRSEGAQWADTHSCWYAQNEIMTISYFFNFTLDFSGGGSLTLLFLFF